MKDYPVTMPCKGWLPLQQAPDASPPGPAYGLEFPGLQLEPQSTAEEKFVSPNFAVPEAQMGEKGVTRVADGKQSHVAG